VCAADYRLGEAEEEEEEEEELLPPSPIRQQSTTYTSIRQMNIGYFSSLQPKGQERLIIR